MATSDFRPEVEIRPFRACAIKIMQHNPYLLPNWQNVRVLQEIGVNEHDGDVRFKRGSENMAILRIETVRSLWTWLLGSPRSTAGASILWGE